MSSIFFLGRLHLDTYLVCTYLFWCFAGYLLLLWTKYLLWLLILNEKIFSIPHQKWRHFWNESLNLCFWRYRVKPKEISGQPSKGNRDLGRFAKIKGKTRLNCSQKVKETLSTCLKMGAYNRHTIWRWKFF